MGLFDRVERKLESAVNGAFARAFRAEVQPVEIASAMRRAMDDRAAAVGRDRMIVPNLYVVDLSPADHERLTSYADVLADELIASVAEHAEQQGYVPGGPFHVDFRSRSDLDTGLFTLRAATAKRLPRGDEPLPAQPQETPSLRDQRREEAAAEVRRAHPFRPPEAQAPAQGATGLASAAASAAAGSLASTAATARAGGVQIPAPDARPAAAPVVPGAPVVPAAPRVDPATRPWLDCDGDHYPLLGAVTVLGRDAEADVMLQDGGISRRHAEVRVTHDGPRLVVTVRDLGSTNGTFVNGERISSAHVEDGDRITVGRTSLTLRLGRL